MIHIFHTNVLSLISDRRNNDQSVRAYIACKHYAIIMFAHQFGYKKNAFCTHEKLLCGSNTFTHSRVEAPDMLRVGTSYKSPLVALVATSYVEKV